MTTKTHKPFSNKIDLKFRGIISCSNSPSQNLEKELNRILNKINAKSEFILNSLGTLKVDTKNVRVERGFCLVTCDITKMFESISIDCLLDDLRQSLSDENNKDCLSDFSHNDVFKSIESILRNSSFRIDSEKHFKLKNGIMTGNSLSVSLANIRLTKIEKELIKNNPAVTFYRRYIDDLIMIVKRSELDDLISKMNSYEFTFNFEHDEFDTYYNEFGHKFLDKFIFVKNKRLCLRWYRKNNSPETTLNFNSASPISWKKSVVLNGYRRIIDSNTEKDGLELDIQRFHKILIKNSYPKQFIQSFNQKLQKLKETDYFQPPKTLREGIKVMLKIPFHNQSVFDKLILMKKQLYKILPNANIHIITTCFRVENLISKYRKISLDDHQKHDLIYLFRCCCEKATYVGETGLTLAARIKSHLRQKSDSAISSHLSECSVYKIAYNKFLIENKIPDVPSNAQKYVQRYFEKLKFTNGSSERRFIESLLIKSIRLILICRSKASPLENSLMIIIYIENYNKNNLESF